MAPSRLGARQSPEGISAFQEIVVSWGNHHHPDITDMFVARDVMSQWDSRSLAYVPVMQAGVLCFVMGLVFFLNDDQPREVWLATLVIVNTVFAALLVAGGMIQRVVFAACSTPENQKVADKCRERSKVSQRENNNYSNGSFTKETRSPSARSWSNCGSRLDASLKSNNTFSKAGTASQVAQGFARERIMSTRAR